MDIRKLLGIALLSFSVSMDVAASPEVLLTGEKIEDDIERITFDGDRALLSFRSGLTLTEDIEDVMVTFSLLASLGLSEANLSLLATEVDGDLSISGLTIGETLSIYSVSGLLLKATTATAETATLDISDFYSGIYLLRAGDKVVKFVKK